MPKKQTINSALLGKIKATRSSAATPEACSLRANRHDMASSAAYVSVIEPDITATFSGHNSTERSSRRLTVVCDDVDRPVIGVRFCSCHCDNGLVDGTEDASSLFVEHLNPDVIAGFHPRRDRSPGVDDLDYPPFRKTT
jgi:hypothetical protein